MKYCLLLILCILFVTLSSSCKTCECPAYSRKGKVEVNSSESVLSDVPTESWFLSES